MSILRRLGGVLAGVALTGSALIAAAPPAAAAGNPYTVATTCGSDYTRNSVAPRALNGATLYVRNNGHTTCVVAIKNKNIGVATYVGAYVSCHCDVVQHKNFGKFKYFAGPVYRDGVKNQAYGGTTRSKSDPFTWEVRGSFN